MSKKLEDKLRMEHELQPGCIVLFAEGGFYRANRTYDKQPHIS